MGSGETFTMRNQSLHLSSNLVWMIKLSRHVVRMERGRIILNILTGKPVGKRPLKRPRRRCEDNIGMSHKLIDVNTRSSIHSAENRDIGESL